jgi:hypothetical protein
VCIKPLSTNLITPNTGTYSRLREKKGYGLYFASKMIWVKFAKYWYLILDSKLIIEIALIFTIRQAWQPPLQRFRNRTDKNNFDSSSKRSQFMGMPSISMKTRTSSSTHLINPLAGNQIIVVSFIRYLRSLNVIAALIPTIIIKWTLRLKQSNHL